MILRDSKSTFCVLLALMAADARAEELVVGGTDFSAMGELAEETRLLSCKNEGAAAANVMLARQMGQSPKQVKKATMATGELDIDLAIKAAFETPRKATQAAQTRESDRFRTRYTVACLNR
ncbi:hypothetical protein [Cypionkella sinensis]|uniref:Uncharacterized protein n=1 Tax=Cypionkella sinensis TaxID=1756043 RepID=A0ABV7IYE0_9RHOB